MWKSSGAGGAGRALWMDTAGKHDGSCVPTGESKGGGWTGLRFWASLAIANLEYVVGIRRDAHPSAQ